MKNLIILFFVLNIALSLIIFALGQQRDIPSGHTYMIWEQTELYELDGTYPVWEQKQLQESDPAKY